jgi:hypothetical protein
VPAGVSYLGLGAPAGQELGPLDSRILVRELTARHRLLEEFPQYFPKGSARLAGSPDGSPAAPPPQVPQWPLQRSTQRPERSTD